MAIGAIVGGGTEEQIEVLRAYGMSTGLAFQLQDDYLDVYGDPAVFGKKIGGDILCGKKTFLLINALDRADAAQRAELLALLDNGEMDPAEKIRAVTALYDALRIAPLTLEAIDRYYAEARRELDALSLPPERWQPLWDYACSLLGRNK